MSAIVSASQVKPLDGTVARKAVMALTGLVLFGFVIVHMIGNVQLYTGPEKLNKYAAFLQGLGPGLWLFRIVLLTAVVLHAVIGIQLWLRNRAARPVRYEYQSFQKGNVASRTMIWSGPAIGLFVVYHILHFTVGSAHPAFVHGDVYNNVVVGFSVPAVAGVYVLAMVALGFHLYHGAFSLFQSLGLRTPKWDCAMKAVLSGVALLVVVVNISFPVAVLAGVVKLAPAAQAPVHAVPGSPAVPGK